MDVHAPKLFGWKLYAAHKFLFWSGHSGIDVLGNPSPVIEIGSRKVVGSKRGHNRKAVGDKKSIGIMISKLYKVSSYYYFVTEWQNDVGGQNRSRRTVARVLRILMA